TRRDKLKEHEDSEHLPKEMLEKRISKKHALRPRRCTNGRNEKQTFARMATTTTNTTPDDSNSCPIPECGKSFATKSYIQLHLRSIHNVAPLNNFRCTYPRCKTSTGYIDEHAAWIHVARNHYECYGGKWQKQLKNKGLLQKSKSYV